MSDAQPITSLIPPGMTVVPKSVQVGMDVEDRFLVTFGTPSRTLEVMPLDLGMQFDLAEVAGANGSNLQWMQMAYAAAATKVIDGVPVSPIATKATLRQTLNKLGMDGFKAAALVANGYRGETAQSTASASEDRDAVKN